MHAKKNILFSGFLRFSVYLVFALTVSGCVVGAGIALPRNSSTAKLPISKTALSGMRQHVAKYYEVNPDCSSGGIPNIKITNPPAHGVASAEPSQDYSEFLSNNQRYECNKTKLPVTAVFYTSEPNFKGADSFEIEVIFPSGTAKTQQFLMTVE